eukprot:8583292-Pyramimonas_sp.AAC.1
MAKDTTMLPGVRSAMWAYGLMRSSRASKCCRFLCMWWLSGCRSCCARDVPTPNNPEQDDCQDLDVGDDKACGLRLLTGYLEMC